MNIRLYVLLFLISNNALAQNFNLVFGLTQPLIVNGGNVEINYLSKDWLFEYSHGWNLNFAANGGLAQTDQENDQKLKLFLPYSTGGGVGYRVTEMLNIRLEYKVHKYNVKNEKTGQKIDYTTRSLGIGVYREYRPFGNSFIVVPNIRYWPNLSNTLSDDRFVFLNGDVHRAHDQGLFINASIGINF